jgi:Tannase and feruloyl esterase
MRSLSAANFARVALLCGGLTVVVTLLAFAPASARSNDQSVHGQAASTGKTITPVTSCSSLVGLNLSTIRGAPAEITSAQQQATPPAGSTTSLGTPTPYYCQVSGYIAPQTNFSFDLPVSTYDGAYLQEGCGGFCGAVGLSTTPSAASGCAPVTQGQFAIGTDNQGHNAGQTDGLWASDGTLKIVFDYTSEHQLKLVASKLLTAYYGTLPAYSYFDGCSDGGREAMDLAERYPHDFNGILAGSEAGNWDDTLGIWLGWAVDTNTNPAGGPIITNAAAALLHAAVEKACANSNGIIADPRDCTFQPSSIQCAAGVTPSPTAPACLTALQAKTATELYQGPRDAQGRLLFDGGEPYGSELGWGAWIIGKTGDPDAPADTAAAQFSLNYLKYMGFTNDPPGTFTLANATFDDATYEELLNQGAAANADDPNLSAFKAAGGKIIIYQGWDDPALTPWPVVDYYAALQRTMGSASAAQFSRLYMIPGAYHCLGGGDPAVSVDLLTPLINWVEGGVAPGSATVNITSYAETPAQPVKTITVAPFNAEAPAPQNNGLNSNYNYIGIRSAYKTQLTWCTPTDSYCWLEENPVNGVLADSRHRRQ